MYGYGQIYFKELVYQIMESDKFKLQGKPESWRRDVVQVTRQSTGRILSSGKVSLFLLIPLIDQLRFTHLMEGFPGGSEVKASDCKRETWVQSLGREDPLEKEMATHSSILAWRIPWMEEPGGL